MKLEIKLILALMLLSYNYDLVNESGEYPDILPEPDEEHGLCYGVKRRKESRSGTSQNPQTPTPNLTPIKNNKSHIL